MKKKLLLFLFCFLFVLFAFWGWLYFNYSVPIFMYHSFDASLIGKYSAVSLDTFNKQMEFIKEGGYKVVLLEDYCKILSSGAKIPRGSVILTFDDGYNNNLEAAKILKKFGFGATIFLIVNKIGDEGYLSKGDIEWFLENTGVSIGSHTLNHVYLPEADAQNTRDEIKFSKKSLEDTFDVEIIAFSYPVGGFNKMVLEQVNDAGYLCACATNRGFSRKIDNFALRRIKITERDLGLRLWAKLSGFYNIFKRVKNPY